MAIEWSWHKYGTGLDGKFAGIFEITIVYDPATPKGEEGPKYRGEFSARARLKDKYQDLESVKAAVIAMAKQQLKKAIEELGGKVTWEDKNA